MSVNFIHTYKMKTFVHLKKNCNNIIHKTYRKVGVFIWRSQISFEYL